MAIQWDKVPSRKKDGYISKKDMERVYVWIPRPLMSQIRAARAQLRKDRKLIHLKTIKRPSFPSMTMLIVKALELMLLPDEKEPDNEDRE